MTNTPGDNITTKTFPFTDKALEGYGETVASQAST
jgi:hypothetical protein